ncbi:MAG: hypothetical protein HF967_10455 [Methanosarcinales archaeon]|nr:hypothetical protein [Methanosarcinales archaeon]
MRIISHHNLTQNVAKFRVHTKPFDSVSIGVSSYNKIKTEIIIGTIITIF